MEPATIISDGIVDAIDALALPGVTVEARKLPIIREGDSENCPLVVVTIGAESFEPATAESGYAYDGFWPVLVTIVTRSPGKTADPATIRSWRWEIRKALMEFCVPASGVIIDGPPRYDANPPFDSGALNSGYDFSPQLFVYRTQEARG